ncbi:MAG: tripartite tricarboxylate transporter substrate binding protein [Pseudolabrys sp.]|jgi:tripartite-type tricarboxylate transporter receptor subunit TctC
MKVVRATLVAFTALLMAAPTVAQTGYPDRPVRIIVGFTAGSATDITARMFAQKLNAAWNVPVTVENIPGAGGSVGGDRVAKAAPDGTTLYWGANGAMTINPSLLPNPTFDTVRDLAPIARVLVMPSLLVVNNDVPAKSVAELFALAKARPGQLSYASPGVGTPQHIAGELLKSLAGVDIVHVPYRGVALADVIGGRVTMTLQNMGAILPVVRDGRLRALAVTSNQRSPIIPELPTLAESGFPDFEAISWFGLLAPANTAAPIIAKVHEEIVKIAAQTDMRERLAQLGLDVAVNSPDEFAAVINADIGKWAKVIKDANIKLSE